MELLVFALTILSLWGAFRWAKRSPLGIVAGAAEVLGLCAVAWFYQAVDHMFPPENLLNMWLAASAGGWGNFVWEGFQKGRLLLHDHKQSHALHHTLQQAGPGLALQGIKQSRRQLQGILPYAPSGNELMATPGEYMEVSVRFIRESNQLRTLLSVSSPRIPYELSISSVQKHEVHNQSWFPGEPHASNEIPFVWEPYERLFGRLEERLGQLPDGLIIEGIERDVLSLMDAKTRDAIDAIARYGELTISARQVTLALPYYEIDPVIVQSRYQAVLDLARLLSLTDDQRNQRLAEMVRDNKDKRRQVRYLELLQHFAPQSELTTAQSRWAISQASPHLRLVGASFLQEGSEPVLQALFEDLTHPILLRKCALQALLKRLKKQALQERCEQVLQGQEDLFCEVALRHLENHQTPGTIAFLCQQIDTMSWPVSQKRCQALLQALGEIATSLTFAPSGAERHVLRILDIAQYDRTIITALRLLSSWGSHAALLPLHQIRRASKSDTQRERFDQCRLLILERIGPVDAGGLSLLPEDDKGKLSMLSPTDGQISLVPTEAPAEPIQKKL